MWAQLSQAVFYAAIVPWLLLPFAIWSYRRSHRKPLLSYRETERWRSLEPFLLQLLPALKAKKSPAMEDFIQKMVEKFYQMQPALTGASQSELRPLSSILKLSSQVAVMLTEVDEYLANPEFHLWGQRLQSLEKSIQDEQDPDRCKMWVDQATDLKMKLGEYFAMEDKFARSMQTLSRLQFLFTYLAGKLIATRECFGDEDRRRLNEMTRELTLIIEANQEIHPEIRIAA